MPALKRRHRRLDDRTRTNPRTAEVAVWNFYGTIGAWGWLPYAGLDPASPGSGMGEAFRIQSP